VCCGCCVSFRRKYPHLKLYKTSSLDPARAAQAYKGRAVEFENLCNTILLKMFISYIYSIYSYM